MPFNTFSVATAVTPSVVETYLSHYFNRGPLRQKPTAHISYHEGLRLIRRFLEFSSLHTIEDLQGFTAQWVPAPTWCRVQSCEIPPQFLERSAKAIREQLGSRGARLVGGEKWWTWRRPEVPLHAEWIEMKKDFNERRRLGVKCDRVILYVHGGAYYFGSVDEHRYQMQRHARKLKARVLAPRYRLAPQFPFPCGLHDCIATYFYLLEHFPPKQILFAGDSAGGGMILAMLVTLRDQGLPLPAGTILLSPWVDLTHSFPSTAGDGAQDYIPAHGFHHRPSIAWPPPPTEQVERKYTQPIEQAFDVVELPATENYDLRSPMTNSMDSENASMMSRRKKTPAPMNRNMTPGLGDRLEIEIDGKKVILKEQIQMYTKNELLTHPLVSAVQQPSLGGLPPMLIQVGGGELLRDEQIYLAHKAADPKNYPPCDAILDDYDPRRTTLNRYPPTDVQLQVWEDLCHVPHTLSFTRPAKYMYRSVAQFGAWALAHAQQKGIEIRDDDAISIISTASTRSQDAPKGEKEEQRGFGTIKEPGLSSTDPKLAAIGAVGRAGDELPPFEDHMIRQRVDRHGVLYPLPPASELACLHLDPATIGALKPGPVRRWLTRRAEHDRRFEKDAKKVAKKKEKEAAQGYDPIEEGENPPPTALYRRRARGAGPEEKKRSKSWGLAMWSGWGSSHDQDTLEREQKVQDEQAQAALRTGGAGASTADVTAGPGGASRTNLAVPGHDASDAASVKKSRRVSATSRLSATFSTKEKEKERERERDAHRPRTPYTRVTDAGQADRAAAASSSNTALSPREDNGMAASWGISRKSSAASSRMARPMSVAAPIPMHTLASSTTGGGSAPTLADTGKEAVKVPGSEQTYLTPAHARPHNGFVAYPFKLAQPLLGGSPNPSTMTLASVAPSSNEGGVGAGPSELVGSEIAAVELPTGVEQRPSGSAEGSPVAASPSSPSTATAPAAAAALHPPAPLTPASRSNSIAPSPLSERPVSVLPPEDAGESPSVARLHPDDDPVSPMEDPAAAAAGSFLRPQGKYASRDSRLGNLGADGMPIGAFPTGVTAAEGVDQENVAAGRPLTATGSGAGASTPFKLRNPVHDARVPDATRSPAVIAAQAAAASAQSSSSAAAAAAARNTESPSPSTATGPTPFKLRNTMDTPEIQSPHLSASEQSQQQPPPRNSSVTAADFPLPLPRKATSHTNLSSAAAMADSHHNGASPHAGRSLPTPIAILPRPLTADSDMPPTPPPKDDQPAAAAKGGRSGGTANGFPPRGTSASASASAAVAGSSSSSPPPMIGALGFERNGSFGGVGGEAFGGTPRADKRPQLETFVTAQEVAELRGSTTPS